jgi:hypothetical protein
MVVQAQMMLGDDVQHSATELDKRTSEGTAMNR